MPEESGPLAGYNFTDAVWRAINGPEPAIVGDVNGSAYNLTLPSGSNVALLGSPTQDSVAAVGGFMHRIPAGQTHGVEIPPSSNPTVGRTDIIVARLDLGAFTSPPGPVRLARVAGVEGSAALPTLDEGPPGTEDFPLWAVTRRSGQGLNQAARRWLGRRSGPNLDVPAGEVLPANVPLGSRAVRGGSEFIRELNSSGAPTWREVFEPVRGDRPALMIYRSSPFSSAISTGSVPFYAGASNAKRGAADTHFTYSYGASQQAQAPSNPARIRVLTDGVYSIGCRLAITPTISAHFGIALNLTPAALPVAPYTRQYVYGEQSSEQTLTETRWLAAGTELRPTMGQNGSSFLVGRWYLWATRIAD